MKTAQLLAVALVAIVPFLSTAGAQLPAAPSTPAAPSPVRVKVEQSSKSDTNGFTRKQERMLKITLTNIGTDSLPLRVKYAFFGREAKSHDTIVVDHSDITTQLQPKSDQTLTTKAQTASLTEEHYEKDKKIPASGQKFTGYGVKIYQNGAVIAEAFDPPSLKDDMATMPGLPDPKKPAAPAKPAAPPAKPAAKPKPATPAPAAK